MRREKENGQHAHRNSIILINIPNPIPIRRNRAKPKQSQRRVPTITRRQNRRAQQAPSWVRKYRRQRAVVREPIRRLQQRSGGDDAVTGGRGRLRVRLETISIGGLLADDFALQEAVEREEVAILAEPLAALLCEHDVSLAGFLQSVDLLGGGCIREVDLRQRGRQQLSIMAESVTKKSF